MLIHKVTPYMPHSDWHRTVLAIFVAALLIRGIFIISLQDGYYFRDSVFYSQAALNLMVHGELGDDYHWPPVYPLFLAGIYAVFGPHIVAVRVVQAVMGAGLAAVIAIMARRIGGERVGVMAGILWSLYPLAIFISGLVYPTSVVTLVLACAVLCLSTQMGQGLSPKRVVIGGVLFGLAILTKYIVLVTVVVITVWMMYWNRTHRFACAALFLAAVTLPLVLWSVYNGQVSGNPTSIKKQFVYHLPEIDHLPTTVDPDVRESKLASILKHPDELVINFLWEFYGFWELYPHRVKMNNAAKREEYHAKDSKVVRKTVVGKNWMSLISILSVGPLFLFALIGAGTMALQAEQRRSLSLLSVTILSFAIGYSFFTSKMRYRIPIEPYIVMFSAYGLMHMWTLCTRWKPMRGMHRYRKTPTPTQDQL